jgi:quercetin dioxygenase-like cupin family protein
MRVTKHAPAKSSLVDKDRSASTDASGDEVRNRTLKALLILLYLMSGMLMAQQTRVTPLMSKDLSEFRGKEGVMLEVAYPPGGSDPIHRHNAYVFVYVLEGTVVMQVKGGEPVTLTPGQTFYEGPNDVHIVGRNASNTKPAKFLVFFIKGKGAPILTTVK